MRVKTIAYCIFFVVFSTGLQAQPQATDSTGAEMIQQYNQAIGKSAILYSGAAYIYLNFPMEGTPFFASDTLTPGWITYDGQLYTDVLLKWDIFQNYVLTQSLISHAPVILRNDLIDSFSIAGHLIKYLPSDKERNLTASGFYDILYNGPTMLIAARNKRNDGSIIKNKFVYTMENRHKYFVQKNGMYSQAANKKDVASLFAGEMPQIKRFMRQNKLRWKRNLEQILKYAVQHHDNAVTR